jgi:hypothetical protein
MSRPRDGSGAGFQLTQLGGQVGTPVDEINMKTTVFRNEFRFALALFALLSGWSVAQVTSQSAKPDAIRAGASRMSLQAKGTFEVSLNAQSLADANADEKLGRMSLDKKFSGDLTGTGKGEMLTAMTGTKGSAAYVAIERVEGVLNGRKGSFMLHHNGLMTRGVQSLVIGVVPDSGTGDLAGITGTLKIDIVDKKHFYDFQYSLPQ